MPLVGGLFWGEFSVCWINVVLPVSLIISSSQTMTSALLPFPKYFRFSFLLLKPHNLITCQNRLSFKLRRGGGGGDDDDDDDDGDADADEDDMEMFVID
jgi:hypothetical protein